jgi:hypothetical protein
MAIDASGNVVVACESVTSSTSSDYVTTKYSSDGSPLWINRYDGPEHSSDYPRSVALDASGNGYVTGRSTSNAGEFYVTIKYSSAGVPLWTNRYGGGDAIAMAVDTNGDAYVTGEWWGIGNVADYTTIKYSNAGVPLWTNRYNGPGNGNDYASAIAVDASGNAVVTGVSIGSSTLPYDGVVTIKYSSAGVPLWTNRCDGEGNEGRAVAVAVDAPGNAFVTGFADPISDMTIAYSSAGVPLWTNRYDGRTVALAVDASGNVFVTGGGTVVKYAAVGPSLSISSVGSQVRIAWPSSTTGWALRRSSVAGGPYNDPSLSVTTEGNESVAYDSIGAGTAFYRLEKQP